MTERTLNKEQNYKEYMNLKRAADIMTTMAEDGCYYEVEDCYLDYGSKWMWTTILKINPYESGILHSCQAINPRQWKEIVACETKADLLELMKTLV